MSNTHDEVSAPEETPVADSGRTRLGNPYLIGAVALLVIAFVCAGFFGYQWVRAANDDNAKFSATRDDVLRVGEGMALNYTSIDYQNFAAYKQRILDSTTGQFHDQIGQAIDQEKAQIEQAKLVVHVSIVAGSVVSLDTHANKATVLAVIRATNTNSGSKQQPAQQAPIVMSLSRADASAPWKAESFSGAPSVGGQ